MNDGSVVKVDGQAVAELAQAAAAEAGAARGDGLVTPRAVGTAEATATPASTPKAPPGERGVHHSQKVLPCVLGPVELDALKGEIVVLAGDTSEAERRIERLKEAHAASIASAKVGAKELRTELDEKVRLVREGKAERPVNITVRVDWNARTKTTTRDDTGEVIEHVAATLAEVRECGAWETDLPAGKAWLKAPDGAVLDQRPLTDAERQPDLPLTPDGGTKVEPPAPADRAWISEKAWDELDDQELAAFRRPVPKGPELTWVADGTWYRADLPVGMRPSLEHYAQQLEVPVAFGPDVPTLASLAAASKEPASKARKKAKSAGKGRAS